jgi:hypothetical protein
MPVLTILNHGTSNSSQGDKTIVISKLESLLGGKSGDGNWMINQGAGSWQLSKDRFRSHLDLPGWQTVGGIFWGKGVDENVDKAVEWVRYKIFKASETAGSSAAGTYVVNLAGHSRGSITCFKIANKLHEHKVTKGCEVNIFAIDPVAGNLGAINSGVYKDIVLQSNVRTAYMFVAETERRTSFRPYIDKIFFAGLPDHRMDSIPGNHGGINELAGKRHESGDVVLHHAIQFLESHGTTFKDTDELKVRKKKPDDLLFLYARIMDNFMDYKDQGKGWFPGGLSKGGRVANVEKGPGNGSKPFLEKNKFEGGGKLGWSGGRGVMGRRPRPCRFFANMDHEYLFSVFYGATCAFLKEAQVLEGDALSAKVGEMANSNHVKAELGQMNPTVLNNLKTWMLAAVG